MSDEHILTGFFLLLNLEKIMGYKRKWPENIIEKQNQKKTDSKNFLMKILTGKTKSNCSV